MMKVDESNKRIQYYSIRLSREEKIQSKLALNCSNEYILQYSSANHEGQSHELNVESQLFVSCAYEVEQ